MNNQELIQEIQRHNPLISQEQILAKLEVERTRTGSLLSDETLLKLIAVKLGVQLTQKPFQISEIMPINRLISGLHDVSVIGRVIAILPVRNYQGAEKAGKLAVVIVADNESILRVILWDERADLIEKGQLKTNQIVRFLHGYTKADSYGKTELHLGKKSLIEYEYLEKTNNYLGIEKFVTKIASLNQSLGNIFLMGTIKIVLGNSNFTRSDGSEGAVLRLILADETGEVQVVVWNEKVSELKNIQANMRLHLINARLKVTENGGLEVHVDSNSAFQIVE